jgi:hypothetical protein
LTVIISIAKRPQRAILRVFLPRLALALKIAPVI